MDEDEFPGGIDLRGMVAEKRRAVEREFAEAGLPLPPAPTGTPFKDPSCAQYKAAAWGAYQAAQACWDAGQPGAAGVYLEWGQLWDSMC